MRQARSAVKQETTDREVQMLNLSSNELLHPASDALLRQITSEMTSDDMRTYPQWSRLLPLLGQHFGVSEQQLALSPGSNWGLLMLLLTLRGRGRLILTVPNYQPVVDYASLLGFEITRLPLRPGSEVADLCQEVRQKPPSVVYVSNPSSPWGELVGIDDVAFLAKTCAKGGHTLIVDECYVDFCGFNHVNLLRECQDLIIIHSMSKSFGLAGARIAAILGPATLISELANWRPAYHVSGASIRALAVCLSDIPLFRAVWADIANTRERLFPTVSRRLPGWVPWKGSGNFLAAKVGSPDVAFQYAKRLLSNEGVRVRPFIVDGNQSGWIRFTVADQARMERALVGMERTWADLPARRVR